MGQEGCDETGAGDGALVGTVLTEAGMLGLEVRVYGPGGDLAVADGAEDWFGGVDLDLISPDACRQHVEENFSVHGMTDKYLEVYRTIIAKG